MRENLPGLRKSKDIAFQGQNSHKEKPIEGGGTEITDKVKVEDSLKRREGIL